MTHRDPESLLRALGEERVPAEDPEALARRRELLIPALGSVIRREHEQARRRTMLRRAAAGLIAAASLSVVIGAAYQLRSSERQQPEAKVTPAALGSTAEIKDVTGTLVVTHAGKARAVSAGEHDSLSGGDELRTPSDGTAFVQTERSAIHVHSATLVDFFPPSAAEERIRVSAGDVDLKVSKQPHSRRSVVVETPNAEVVVRGTEFSVGVTSEQGLVVTSVRVTEGAVWVLHDGERELLSQGDVWSSRAASKPAADATVPASSAETVATPAASRSTASKHNVVAANHPPTASHASGGSTLSEQNAMFQAALDARNQGDDRRALELFGALLARFPGGYHTQDAKIERMRALRRLGNAAAAATEARRYLAEHPSGYARDEARQFALGGD